MTENKKRLIFTILPPAIALLCLVLREQIMWLSHFMPPCVFHSMTGLWCPGCGNTRAARELLSLHFVDALRYNVSFPILLGGGILYYAEYVISAWIKPVRLIPRKPWFYAVIGGLFFIYCIVRNIVEFMPDA